MMVVGTSPDTARAQDQDSENPHQRLRQPGMRQNRLVLLIVINYEKPEKKQPGQDTAGDPARKVKAPECSRHGAEEENRRGDQVNPTPDREIACEGFGGQNDLFTSSHTMFQLR